MLRLMCSRPASSFCPVDVWKYHTSQRSVYWIVEVLPRGSKTQLVVMSKMQVILFKFNAETVEIIKQKMTQEEARAEP